MICHWEKPLNEDSTILFYSVRWEHWLDITERAFTSQYIIRFTFDVHVFFFAIQLKKMQNIACVYQLCYYYLVCMYTLLRARMTSLPQGEFLHKLHIHVSVIKCCHEFTRWMTQASIQQRARGAAEKTLFLPNEKKFLAPLHLDFSKTPENSPQPNTWILMQMWTSLSNWTVYRCPAIHLAIELSASLK